MPAVGNAAKGVAVEVVPAGNCPFRRIAATIDTAMEKRSTRNQPLGWLEHAMENDLEARQTAEVTMGNTTAPSRVPVS